MAGGFKATLDVKCWKEHTCCYCGAPYRYLLTKKMTGHGPNQADAAAAARTAAVRALRSELALRPCPGCGNHQPDMIGSRRLSRHVRVFLVTVVIFLSLFLLGAFDLLPGYVTLMLLVLCAFPILLINTWIGARNPNSNLRANKALAERLVGQHVLQAVPANLEGEERPRAVVIENGVGYWLAFLLLGGTLVLMPGAELVRIAGRWPSNPDWHPSIVGPGDSAWMWVHTEKPIESLRGEWRATGKGKILNAKALNFQQDTIDLQTVISRDASWSDLRAMAGSAGVPVQLWVRVKFPSHRQLERRHVSIKVDLDVTILETDPNDKGRVVEKHVMVPHPAELDLASNQAGFQYAFFWYVAMLGGGLMFVLAGGYHMLRDRALKQCGLPTRVVPVADLADGEPVVAPAPAAAPQPAAPPVKPAEPEKTEAT